MKRVGILMALIALCGAMVLSDPAEAYRGYRGGVGWRGGGWHGAGWRGARYGWRGHRYGWRGGAYRYGWRGGYRAGYGGWRGYPLAGAVAGAAATGAYYGYNYPYYGYGSSYGYAPSASANPAPAPLITGRSVATGQIGCTGPKGVPFTNSRVMPDGQLRPYDPAIDGPCR